MFLSIQYPITDLRTILANTNKLRKPLWKDPEVNTTLRYFGSIVKRGQRQKQAVLQWPADEKYCNSRNAIKLKELSKGKISAKDSVATFNCMYRRFFKPGDFTCRFEIAFTHSADKLANNNAAEISPVDFDETFATVIKSFLNLKINIPKSGKRTENTGNEKKQITAKEFIELPLYLAGNRIAELYLKGSTKNKLQGTTKSWWVKAGTPLALVTCIDRGNLVLPRNIELVEKMEAYGICLYSLEQPMTKTQAVRVWLITLDPQKKSRDSIIFLRQLKLNLFKINAEKEALRHVLLTISDNDFDLKEDNARDSLSRYLKNSTSTLLKKKRFGINQDKILDSAIRSEELVDPGSMKKNLELLKPLKDKYIITNVSKLSPGEKKLVRIFIGHSNDVDNERKECILQIGKVNKSHRHLFLEYVNWHDDVVHSNFPDYKRIQDAINIKLKSCQVAIFIFKSKLGQYTLEEFEFATNKKKRILVLNKKNIPLVNRSNSSYKKLQRFIKSLNDEVLYEAYNTLADFRSSVYTNLNLYLSEKYKLRSNSARKLPK